MYIGITNGTENGNYYLGFGVFGVSGWTRRMLGEALK